MLSQFCSDFQVVEEKLGMMKAEPPWAGEIEQYGPVDFEKLFLLLTGFRNIPPEKYGSGL